MHKLLLSLLLMLFSLPFAVQLNAATPDGEMMQQQDPGAELWNAVRGRVTADAGQVRTQVQGVDNTVLVNRNGEDWMKFRMEELIPNAAKLLGFIALAIIVFRLIRGKIPIKAGRSDQKIKRFSTFQRYVHWITAILFVVLAITGIALMFGRYIIMPLFADKAAAGSFMSFMKQVHDLSGPLFAVALVVLTLTFIKGNFIHPSDFKWLLKGGGLFGGHAPAGRYNAGEKGWYWIAVIIGGAVVVSGLILDIPNFEIAADFAANALNFEADRNTISYFHWIHSLSTVIIMAAAMGHIYMGTIAMEGAFEAMQTGYCDSNWAREHHDLWYKKLVEQGEISPTAESETESTANNDQQNQVAPGGMIRETSTT